MFIYLVCLYIGFKDGYDDTDKIFVLKNVTFEQFTIWAPECVRDKSE